MFGFGGSCTVEIVLEDGVDKAHTRTIKSPKAGSKETYPLYFGDEVVSGRVIVKVGTGKKFEHSGIQLELIGQIDLYNEYSQVEFTKTTKELAPAGTISEMKIFSFSFESPEKVHETYHGTNVRLRYFLRVTAAKQYSSNVTKEREFWVQNTSVEPDINTSIKMEVGVENCVHIEFEYNRSKYHLKDVVIGKVYFLLVRIKIKYMEMCIIKRETTGSGSGQYDENENIVKYEIMDGCPVRGESIPVRLFLNPYPLTPTYRSVCNKFSVRYFLNLVIVDEDNRRYYKQQEIVLWRRPTFEFSTPEPEPPANQS